MASQKKMFSNQGIMHESELDKDFGRKIAENAHGEKLFGCIQCGNCSSACPLSVYMDYTPRKVIAMVRAGFKKDVLSNRTVWLCASCYNCSVECPKSIKITDVMYALKREAIENKIYPRGFSIPILTRSFFSLVKRTGRINEVWLLLDYYLRFNILSSISYLPVAIKLFLTGRINPFEKNMKGKKDVQKLLQS